MYFFVNELVIMAAMQSLADEGDDDNDHGNTANHLEIEWEHLKTIRRADGYREGISAGKEAQQQQGFNNGYEVGFASIQHVAELRGKLWGISTMIQMKLPQDHQKQVTEQLHGIIAKLTALEQEIVKDTQLQYPNHCENDTKRAHTASPIVYKPEQLLEISKEKQQYHEVQLSAIKENCLKIFNNLNLNDWYIEKLKSLT